MRYVGSYSATVDVLDAIAILRVAFPVVEIWPMRRDDVMLADALRDANPALSSEGFQLLAREQENRKEEKRREETERTASRRE